ncbi:SIS domain-containing protein [Thermodesulfobacteriota bacterium]
MTIWPNYIKELNNNLTSLSARDDNGQELNPGQAFSRLVDMTSKVREAGKTVYLIGNGASASMASHVAADLAKNAHIRTQVFTDLSLLTSIANDLSFDDIYAEPLRRRLVDGDMLVSISSSGQSLNIINAVREAKRLGGHLVTLSAMRPNNILRSLGNINLYIPAKTYGMAETCHAALLHLWIDLMTKTGCQT